MDSGGDQGGGNPREISPTGFGYMYRCGICQCLLNDAMMSLCGHRFCRLCILRILLTSAGRYYCQRCFTEDNQVVQLQSHQVYPDMATRREIGRLPAQCRVCDWTGTYRYWEQHLREICPMSQQLRPPVALNEDQPLSEMVNRVAALEDQITQLTITTANLTGNLAHIQGQAYMVLTIWQNMRQLEESLADINAARQQGSPSYDGTLLWAITGYAQKKQQAIQGTLLSWQSPDFYTGRYGYRLSARVYLNGDGMGRGTHLSLFLVVMKGDYDNLQIWPFQQQVLFQLVNRGQQNLVQTIRPDPNARASQRPTAEQNVGCGFPEFAPQQIVEDRYIRDDTLFINIQVDIRGLHNPVPPRFPS